MFDNQKSIIFRVKNLTTNEESNIEISPISEGERFALRDKINRVDECKGKKITTKENVYYRPSSDNYPGIDSFIYFYQVIYYNN